jgi:hypothetical protein
MYLPTCVVSTFLYDAWSVWHLHSCIKSSFLYDLLNFIMSANLHVVCSTVWCLPACMLSVQLYDVCLAIWFLPTRMMSAQLRHVCQPFWYLFNCMTSAYWWGVCYSVLIDMMSICMMCAYLSKVGVRNLSPHPNSAILQTTKSIAELRTKKVAELQLRTFELWLPQFRNYPQSPANSATFGTFSSAQDGFKITQK